MMPAVHMRTHHLLAVSLVLTSLAAPVLARADCAEPPGYASAVTGNTVVVCAVGGLEEFTGCPETGGMLRVDVASGGVAKLPDSCVPPPATIEGSRSTACYEDQCVPPGTYQYGYAAPFACEECGAESATVVKVTSPLSGCTSDAGALTDAGSAPWDAASAVDDGVANAACDHANPVDAGRHDASSVVSGRDAGGGSRASSGGGCSTSAASSQHMVLAIDALALVLGLGVLARRRARRSA